MCIRDSAPYFARCCTQGAAVRDETAQALRALGFTVTDSKTNFLFAGCLLYTSIILNIIALYAA